MPNIAITAHCNLKCPYCFASTMIETQQENNISFETLDKILDWLEPSASKNTALKIGVIGGEPTLHPQFIDILNRIDEWCQSFRIKRHVLFTNGIILHRYMQDIPNSTQILLNYNSPTGMTADQAKQLEKTMHEIGRLGWFLLDEQGNAKVTLGLNLCQEIDDYSFFWDAVDKYNVQMLRVSVTAPIHFEALKDKFTYYESLKPKFLEFVKQMHLRPGPTLTLDCNQIPTCFFTKEEIHLIDSQATRFVNKVCSPVIDITPDFTASSCFGAYKEVNCEDFKDLDQLNTFMIHKAIVPMVELNNDGRCKDCREHEFLSCQGGCLAFAKPKLINDVK